MPFTNFMNFFFFNSKQLIRNKKRTEGMNDKIYFSFFTIFFSHLKLRRKLGKKIELLMRLKIYEAILDYFRSMTHDTNNGILNYCFDVRAVYKRSNNLSHR